VNAGQSSSSNSDTVKKVLPGQPGTKKLLAKYGQRLWCVRYRYDSQRQRRFKTIEIIVEQKPWRKNRARIPANKTVYLRVSYGEVEVGRLVRSAGGKWNREKRLWEIPYGEVKALGLEARVVEEVTDTRNKSDWRQT